jgi:uncharacterized membrane protein HdeD (DUF308 family)
MSLQVGSSEEKGTLDSRIWVCFALRGTIALLFGGLSLARPGFSVTSLSMLFGGYALLDGVFVLLTPIKFARWRRMLLVGGVGVVIGVFAFGKPPLTTEGLLWGIGDWAMSTGLLQVAAAFQRRPFVPGEWTLGTAGVLSFAFGVLIAAHHAATLRGFAFIGLFFILFGLLQTRLAFQLFGQQRRLVPA